MLKRLTGQRAEVWVDGQRLESDAKIYLESFALLKDGAGGTFVLGEIEVVRSDGGRDSFYVFSRSFGLPEPGSELTVTRVGNVIGNVASYEDLAVADLALPRAQDDTLVLDESDIAFTNLLANDLVEPGGDL